jgi:hypothetical protein
MSLNYAVRRVSIADKSEQVKQIRTIYQAYASLSRQKHLEFIFASLYKENHAHFHFLHDAAFNHNTLIRNGKQNV